MLDITVHNAIIFAAEKHKSQIRKGSGLPYIVHPLEVMQILQEHGCSTDVVIAGILHDVLEDTNATCQDIRQNFGEHVLSLILSETQNKNKPWKERRQEALTKIQNESIEVQQVCCADKLSNIRSIYADSLTMGESVFQIFNAPKEDVKWYYKSLVIALNKIDDYKMKQDFKDLVEKVFG